MKISSMTLAGIGRFVAVRTANMEAAQIAHSTAPQLHYDSVIFQMLRDPNQRAQFTADESPELAERISDATRRKSALNMLHGNYY